MVSALKQSNSISGDDNASDIKSKNIKSVGESISQQPQRVECVPTKSHDDEEDDTCLTQAPVQIGYIFDPNELSEEEKQEYEPPLNVSFVTDANDLKDIYLNRIGGIPTWLNPLKPATAKQLSCQRCESPMALLLQLYTPEDEPEDAFHRLVHVFVCKNGKCHKQSKNSGFKVFRSQFADNNSIYNPDTCQISVATTNLQFCDVCGGSSHFKCGSCSRSRYCSKAHQIWSWKNGHKDTCSSSTDTASSIKVAEKSSRITWTYPVKPIESEPEPEKSSDPKVTVDSIPQSFPNITAAEDPTFDDAYEDSSVGVDKAFLKFEKRISRAPEQILRYNRVASKEASDNEINQEPLFISDEPKLASSNIPLTCPHCQSRRTFEFQIMPQILNHLDLDHEDPDALDFGTILVFSCDRNCHVGDGVLLEEVWWRQDPTGHGLQDIAKQHQMEQIQKNMPDVV